MTRTDIDTSNPLDVNLTGMDSALPKFKPGTLAEFKIEKALAVTNEAKTLKLQLTSLVDLPSDVDGVNRKAGSSLFMTVNTVPTGACDPKTFGKGPNGYIALANAIGKPITLRQLQENVENLQGNVITVRTKIKPASDGYPESDTVGEFIRKPQASTT